MDRRACREFFGELRDAATTLLDFEDITAPATINAQYAPRGAIFQQAYLVPTRTHIRGHGFCGRSIRRLRSSTRCRLS